MLIRGYPKIRESGVCGSAPRRHKPPSLHCSDRFLSMLYNYRTYTVQGKGGKIGRAQPAQSSHRPPNCVTSELLHYPWIDPILNLGGLI
jgi:hypothetical protein